MHWDQVISMHETETLPGQEDHSLYPSQAVENWYMYRCASVCACVRVCVCVCKLGGS